MLLKQVLEERLIAVKINIYYIQLYIFKEISIYIHI